MNPFGRPLVQRRVALTLLVCGLALRALIPVGYMPAFDAGSQTIRIGLCQGIAGWNASATGSKAADQAVDIVLPSRSDTAPAAGANDRCPYGLVALGALAQVEQRPLTVYRFRGHRARILVRAPFSRDILRPAHRPRGPPAISA